MIIALAVTAGFRNEIRNNLSSVAADIQLLPSDMSLYDESTPIEADAAYLPYVQQVDGVEKISPVVYRAGIVKSDENIQGVVVKGIRTDDSLSLHVSIPSRLADITGLQVGDKMTTYFISEKIMVRRFTISDIYENSVQADENLIVYARLEDMQRLNLWGADMVSSLEIDLDEKYKSEEGMRAKREEIGSIVHLYSVEDEESVIVSSAYDNYPQLFDWLNLIDFNALIILMLMTIVAGFNMISGLLILLFEHISMIGLLKTLGMRTREIAKVFLGSSAICVAKGMLWGNLIAGLFCLIQHCTHLIKLNPENYFVSFVPVHLDWMTLLSVNVISFVTIMIFLMIPCVFISRVDPAQTVRVK